MNRTAFEKIKAAYEKRDKDFLKKGQFPMRSTAKGFWGTSNVDDVYEWFEKMNFPPETKFIDLGAGDGRVALVANLFVDAQGIEYDEELVRVAKEIAEELGFENKTFQGDWHDLDFSDYDRLFMYMDQNFNALETKLKKELRGTLHLYHETYFPYFLKKGKITWVRQIPIFSYTNDTILEE